MYIIAHVSPADHSLYVCSLIVLECPIHTVEGDKCVLFTDQKERGDASLRPVLSEDISLRPVPSEDIPVLSESELRERRLLHLGE